MSWKHVVQPKLWCFPEYLYLLRGPNYVFVLPEQQSIVCAWTKPCSFCINLTKFFVALKPCYGGFFSDLRQLYNLYTCKTLCPLTLEPDEEKLKGSPKFNWRFVMPKPCKNFVLLTNVAKAMSLLRRRSLNRFWNTSLNHRSYKIDWWGGNMGRNREHLTFCH